MSEQTKDKDVRFNYQQIKNTTVGQGGKGELRVQLSFTKEAIPALVEALTGLADNERGVKLDAHIYDQQSQDGREFKSTVLFVKPIQEFGSQRPGGPTKFKNAFPGKAAATPAVSAASVAAARESVTKRLA